MEVKEYEDARLFLENYESIMLEQEAVSQLILYHAYQQQNADSSTIKIQNMFGAVIEEGKAVLLFCNLLPQYLIVYMASSENVLLAAAELADFIETNHILIHGIMARNDICQSFMEQYMKQVSCTFSEMLTLDIMEIRQVKDVKLAEGAQRLALTEDAKLVADWMIEFQIEALLSEMDYEAALERAMRHIDNNEIYLFENEEKKVVSMAVAARKLAHGIAVTYVFTPEEYRGNGYAAANMYYLCRQLLLMGYEFCTLFVDKKNLLSSRAYEKVGFKTLEENYEYRLVPAEV